MNTTYHESACEIEQIITLCHSSSLDRKTILCMREVAIPRLQNIINSHEAAYQTLTTIDQRDHWNKSDTPAYINRLKSAINTFLSRIKCQTT